SAVLGEVDNGFGILMGELARERLALAVGALASTEGVLEETVAYVKERQAFGQPIAAFQNTRYTLADLATDVRVHRAFIDQCCQQFMDGTLDVATVSMAKLATTEMQKRVIDSCLQLRSEEHTSELQSRFDLVCRLLLEKKKKGLMSRSDACA